MARTKIDFGIDLGTTNSSIARMLNGNPTITKSEGYDSDTTPSCVSFSKKQSIYVGEKALNQLNSERRITSKRNDPSLLNTFGEFKRDMGTDIKYECKNMERSFTPEELSAEVLKSLKSYIRDEDINAVVITVPAKFKGYQKDATKRAAELAGFQHCVLLQEPIAASMAYGFDANSVDGYWVVFDFGGGTFDAALMKADESIMKVVDTEGDNHLGGKDIDNAIVEKIIIPYLKYEYAIENILSDENRKEQFRNTLKRYAEEVKKYMSLGERTHYDIASDEPIGEDDQGNEMFIDLTVKKEKYEETVKPIFQRAVDITQKLLQNNNLSGSDLTTVLLVGGPTFSQTLRDMITAQITPNINTSIDPMTAVAIGAALIASTKSIPEGIQEIDKKKIQLTLKYPETTVETEENFGIRINRNKTEGEIPERLFVEVSRQDKGWSSGKVEIIGDADILSIQLDSRKPNGFNVIISDEKGHVYPSEPDSFSIIQGFTAAGATLPFDLCIEAVVRSKGDARLVGLDGLKKNQPLPAKGKGEFLTQKDIRPGNKDDLIKIPIYEGSEGTPAAENEFRGKASIGGELLPSFLPKGSVVELIVEVDESEFIKVIVSFPYLDGEIIEVTLPKILISAPEKEDLEKKLERANDIIDNLEEACPELDLVKVKKIRDSLNDIDSEIKNGVNAEDTRIKIRDSLRENMIEMDALKSDVEWPKVKHELEKALDNLESTSDQSDDENIRMTVKELNDQAKAIISKQDINMTIELTKRIGETNFAIMDQIYGVAIEISLIKDFDEKFDMHDWKNRNQARQLINEAKNIITSNRATQSTLRPIVGELFSLLPPADQNIIKPDDDLLMK